MSAENKPCKLHNKKQCQHCPYIKEYCALNYLSGCCGNKVKGLHGLYYCAMHAADFRTKC